MKSLRFITRHQSGDTIVEVLISISILGVVVAGSYSLANRNLSSGQAAEQRTQALASAQSQIGYVTNAHQNGSIDTYKNFAVANGDFCVLSNPNQELKKASDPACKKYNGQAYEIAVKYQSNLFTITANWTDERGANQENLALYYKLPGAYTGPGPAVPPPSPSPSPSPAPGGPSPPISVSPPGSVQRWGSFENGDFSEYGDSSQGGCKVSFATSPVREGRYSGFFDGANPCYTSKDEYSRIHLLAFPTGTGVDMEPGAPPFWWAFSLNVPSNPSLTFFAGNEIHQSNTNDRCTQGPAPYNTSNQRGIWQLIVRGSNAVCYADQFATMSFGSATAFGCTASTCKDWANGVSATIQAGEWYDFLIGFQMADNNSGWFEAWVNGPGTNGKSIQVVPRTHLPTSYPQLISGAGKILPNYPMDSLYYSSASLRRTLYYDGGAMSTDFNALVAWQNSFTNSW